MQMRLQRFLSQAGVASRRHAEELILAGKVWVNGHPVTELGSKVDPDRDRVTIDGKRVQTAARRYLVMVKPRGYVTTRSDPEGRQTVMQLLGKSAPGVYPVGRLDFNTDGVLLLTNDGDLANALMHPSGGVQKVYHAKLDGAVTEEAIQALRDGVVLDDGVRTAPAEVMLVTTTGRHSWLQIGIKQGLNRQIHRMAETVGHKVLKLSRVAYGPISSEGLRPGEWRDLTDDELLALRRAAGLAAPEPEPRARPREPKASRPPEPRAGASRATARQTGRRPRGEGRPPDRSTGGRRSTAKEPGVRPEGAPTRRGYPVPPTRPPRFDRGTRAAGPSSRSPQPSRSPRGEAGPGRGNRRRPPSPRRR